MFRIKLSKIRFIARNIIQTVGLIAWSLYLIACDQAQPKSYLIPKEDRSADIKALPSNSQTVPSANDEKRPMQILPGMTKAAAGAGSVEYKVPKGWKEITPNGIRKVNLLIEDELGQAELTVLAFPGDVGGRLANINRWREQIGLKAASLETLTKITEPYIISQHNGFYVRLEGDNKSILGAMLPFHNYTWFFKLLGDTSTVLANEAKMKDFIDSVRLQDRHH